MPHSAEQYLDQFDQAKAARANWDATWQEIRDLLYPGAEAFNVVEADGSKTHQKVYDGSGEYASEDLTAFLHGTVCNPAIRWAGLKDEDDDLNEIEEVSLWLEDTNRRMFSMIYSPRAHFVRAQTRAYREIVDYGTGAKFVQERPGDVPLFIAIPLKQLYIEENHEGDVDALKRCFPLTARQAVQKWGDRVGPKVANAAKDPKKQNDTFTFLHCVHPRDEADRYGTHGGKNMPIASVYVCIEDKSIVVESGFPEMPYIVPRWFVRAGEKYGRGCGNKALADVKMLQRAMRAQIRGTEKASDPPLLLPDDGLMSPARNFAGGVIKLRADLLTGRTDPLRYLVNPARLDVNEAFCEAVRQRIDRAFYGHLMRLQQDPRMTATQVLDVAEKTQTAIGPNIGNLESEDLGPTINRVFAIGQRSGRFLPPPDVLKNRELKVEYLSPISRAQALAEVRGISQTYDVLAPMFQANPELADNFDQDKTARIVATRLGFPREAIRDPKLVAKMRSTRTKVQQDQTNLAQAHATADAAGKAAPALKLLMGGNTGDAAA